MSWQDELQEMQNERIRRMDKAIARILGKEEEEDADA